MRDVGPQSHSRLPRRHAGCGPPARCTALIALALAGVPVFVGHADAAEVTVLTAKPVAPVYRLHDGAGKVIIELADGGLRRLRVLEGRLVVDAAGTAVLAPRARRPDMLPDGEVVRGSRNVVAAWLVHPTARYRHGVLGDALEAAGVRAQLSDGRTVEYRLDSRSVFEDRRVRLHDLTGDGRDELVVVRSTLERGAAVAVLATGPSGLVLRAESEPIGRPRRWLNSAGVADFDGDGESEIAAVLTPHIGGVLVLYRLAGRRLQPILARPGFSNHALGSRELGMAAVADVNDDGIADLVLPNAARRTMMAIGFAQRRYVELAAVPHAAPVVTNLVAAALDGRPGPEIAYALADGTVVVLLFGVGGPRSPS